MARATRAPGSVRKGARQPVRTDFRRSVGLTLGYTVAKSVLASRQSKAFADRHLGPRVRNGLYRPAYIAFSAIGAGVIFREVYAGPHRVLYEVPKPYAYAFRAAQLGMLLSTGEATRVIGSRFFGVPQLRAFLAGDVAEVEPEAQGPARDHGQTELSQRTVFGVTRHPNNWFPTMGFLFEPNMTDKRAVFCAMVVVHGLVGSVHEEHRLRAQYGAVYDRYVQAVPFLFGRRARRSGAPPTAATEATGATASPPAAAPTAAVAPGSPAAA